MKASLAQITVYPIKSLDGVSVDACGFVSSGGLEWDRRLAIVDGEGNWVNGKRSLAVHLIRATYDLPSGTVRLKREGAAEAIFDLHPSNAGLAEWLSEALGLACSLVEDLDAGFPDDAEATGPTLIGSATLNAVASWFPGLSEKEVGRRLRTNLVIDAPSAFWEDRLVASRKFSIGGAAFHATSVCQRCVVPSRDSMTGLATQHFAKRFAEQREQNLPEESPRVAFNHFYRVAINTQRISGTGIAVGDEVAISPFQSP